MPNRRTRRSSNDRIVIQSVRRKEPDISKIAKAVIGLALEQAAREAQAQQQNSATAPRVANARASRQTSKGSEPDA